MIGFQKQKRHKKYCQGGKMCSDFFPEKIELIIIRSKLIKIRLDLIKIMFFLV